MITKAVLARFESRTGRDDEIERLSAGARPFVARKPATAVWFGLHYGRGDYGIFDVFPDNGARFAHLTGHVSRGLAKHALTLLGGMPEMHLLDVAVVSYQSTVAA